MPTTTLPSRTVSHSFKKKSPLQIRAEKEREKRKRIRQDDFSQSVSTAITTVQPTRHKQHSTSEITTNSILQDQHNSITLDKRGVWGNIVEGVSPEAGTDMLWGLVGALIYALIPASVEKTFSIDLSGIPGWLVGLATALLTGVVSGKPGIAVGGVGAAGVHITYGKLEDIIKSILEKRLHRLDPTAEGEILPQTLRDGDTQALLSQPTTTESTVPEEEQEAFFDAIREELLKASHNPFEASSATDDFTEETDPVLDWYDETDTTDDQSLTPYNPTQESSHHSFSATDNHPNHSTDTPFDVTDSSTDTLTNNPPDTFVDSTDNSFDLTNDDTIETSLSTPSQGYFTEDVFTEEERVPLRTAYTISDRPTYSRSDKRLRAIQGRQSRRGTEHRSRR